MNEEEALKAHQLWVQAKMSRLNMTIQMASALFQERLMKETKGPVHTIVTEAWSDAEIFTRFVGERLEDLEKELQPEGEENPHGLKIAD